VQISREELVKLLERTSSSGMLDGSTLEQLQDNATATWTDSATAHDDDVNSSVTARTDHQTTNRSYRDTTSSTWTGGNNSDGTGWPLPLIPPWASHNKSSSAAQSLPEPPVGKHRRTTKLYFFVRELK